MAGKKKVLPPPLFGAVITQETGTGLTKGDRSHGHHSWDQTFPTGPVVQLTRSSRHRTGREGDAVK